MILAIMAFVFALLPTPQPISELARTVEGEASTCSFEAKLAVANVASRNPTFYGDADPSYESWYAAWRWREYEDPSHGAHYLFSGKDLQGPIVREIVAGLPLRAWFHCATSTLYAY